MKKQLIIIFLLAFFFIVILTTTINATDVNLELKNNDTNSKINPGDTFEAYLNASCEDGISGFVATIEYDENVFELIETKVNNKFVNLGEDLKFEIIINTSDTIKDTNIITFKFKVKEDVSLNDAKIYAKDITIEPDNGKTKSIENRELNIEINNSLKGIKAFLMPISTSIVMIIISYLKHN